MRYCGNCEWSISSLCEEEMMFEYDYDVDEQTIPKIGDCLLSMDHGGRYVCREHNYIGKGISNYLLYDDTYLGPVYFIVTGYNDEIVKFIKLYQMGDGFPGYAIRAYDVDLSERRYIGFELSKTNTCDDKLLDVINSFILKVGNLGVAGTFELHNDGDVTFITAFSNYDSGNNYIDVYLGDYNTCPFYKDISLLFRDLAWVSLNKSDENTMKRIRKYSK